MFITNQAGDEKPTRQITDMAFSDTNTFCRREKYFPSA